MLVGDPQQLNPVILLNEAINEKLKKKYMVSEEYDYCKNSIYKVFLASDSVSDEILLHYHYRCNKKIIDFNNKKYYNSRLQIRTKSSEQNPLVYVDLPNATTNYKNTAPDEVAYIIDYLKKTPGKSVGIITPFVNQKNAIQEKIDEAKLKNITCGTVHSFQGDEKDIIVFSTAITDKTTLGTYEWLKNNKELINVATSRAKEQLIVLSDSHNMERLHSQTERDDLYELFQYVRDKGETTVSQVASDSRALGVKPFSSEIENEFMKNLNHAMGNIMLAQNRYEIEKEVGIAHVFNENITYSDLFYSGRFDFVVYENHKNVKLPVLAIELDGKEHLDNEVVKHRDQKKNEICRAHNLQLIRVENCYARRYNYVKAILKQYFDSVR